MKKALIFTFFLATVAILSVFAVQGKPKSDDAEAAQVKQKLAGRDYTIDVRTAYPTGGRAIQLTTSDYSLTIKGDSIDSYLPYFGRAYSIPYGGGDGLVFKSTIENYQSAPGKKDQTEVTFEARTPEDRYQFRITLFTNGSGMVYVQSGQRQPISFGGEMVLDEPKE